MMIYFDNASTSLLKPNRVGAAVSAAIHSFGNASRGLSAPSRLASAAIDKARSNIARLIGLNNPLNIAFLGSGTEALNLVIGGLISPSDSVISSHLEHNAVLRPLYLSKANLSFLSCDKHGNVDIDSFDKVVKKDTKFLVCTHGSNVTGSIVDAKALYKKCKAHGITMILDICQTLGTVEVDMDMADIFCFTGHKGLFGTQGIGGIIIKEDKHDFKVLKTGGAGFNSYDKLHASKMPDIFEVGTINAHGLAGLNAGLEFIFEVGIDEIEKREWQLTKAFYDGIKGISGVKVYGDFETGVHKKRLPIVSINIDGMTAGELGTRLESEYDIVTRASIHCAPLMHKFFGTDKAEWDGMVRCSFSYFNTMGEVGLAINAIKEIAKNAD